MAHLRCRLASDVGIYLVFLWKNNMEEKRKVDVNNKYGANLFGKPSPWEETIEKFKEPNENEG